MKRTQKVKIFLWILNCLIIFLFLYSLINYKILNNQATELALKGGLLAMVLFVIILEGAPVFIGPSVAVATLLSMNSFSPWLILFLFLLSALIGNVIYFYLGYYSGERMLKYFNKKNVKKYKFLFKKYGTSAMLIMAVSPIPYLPTLAGVFRMSSKGSIALTLIVRIIRHIIVFTFWYYIILGF